MADTAPKAPAAPKAAKAMKATGTIIYQKDKKSKRVTFNEGDTVTGLSAETMKKLQESGAVA